MFFVWFGDTKSEIRLLTCGVHLSVSLFFSLYSSSPIFVPYAREVGHAVPLGGAGAEIAGTTHGGAQTPPVIPFSSLVSPALRLEPHIPGGTGKSVEI